MYKTSNAITKKVALFLGNMMGKLTIALFRWHRTKELTQKSKACYKSLVDKRKQAKMNKEMEAQIAKEEEEDIERVKLGECLK